MVGPMRRGDERLPQAETGRCHPWQVRALALTLTPRASPAFSLLSRSMRISRANMRIFSHFPSSRRDDLITRPLLALPKLERHSIGSS